MHKIGTKNTKKTTSHKGFTSYKKKNILKTINTSRKYILKTNN